MKSKMQMVEVITMRMSDMEITDCRTINYDNGEQRTWLAKHSAWALHHGHGVQTSPIKGTFKK